MKIIDGIKYYNASEVAILVNKSAQMVRLWARWSDEREALGLERFIPKPLIIGGTNARYWSEYDVGVIGYFSHHKPRGLIRDYSKRQWSNKYIPKKKPTADEVLDATIASLEKELNVNEEKI